MNVQKRRSNEMKLAVKFPWYLSRLKVSPNGHAVGLRLLRAVVMVAVSACAFRQESLSTGGSVAR